MIIKLQGTQTIKCCATLKIDTLEENLIIERFKLMYTEDINGKILSAKRLSVLGLWDFYFLLCVCPKFSIISICCF